ncbi:MAG TPA: carboxypeptidase-like regulatory domain-containing protein, partial [Terriglobales bacterium]|nr:carboxypeptidase-like regulatory domain-containing protein [Terriglobales bacterium]
MIHKKPSSRTLANVTQTRDCQNKRTARWFPRLSHRRWELIPLLTLALVCFAFPSALRAQVTATLSGTVEDPSGGVIPGAQVTLTNEATNQSRVVETNATGLYAFPSLVPGTYSLTAAAKGF